MNSRLFTERFIGKTTEESDNERAEQNANATASRNLASLGRAAKTKGRESRRRRRKRRRGGRPTIQRHGRREKHSARRGEGGGGWIAGPDGGRGCHGYTRPGRRGLSGRRSGIWRAYWNRGILPSCGNDGVGRRRGSAFYRSPRGRSGPAVWHFRDQPGKNRKRCGGACSRGASAPLPFG